MPPEQLIHTTETNKVPFVLKTEEAAVSPMRHLADVMTGTVSPSSIFAPTLTDLLSKAFVAVLPPDPRVECAYWSCEGALLRVWTIIDHADALLEEQIYNAQLTFMDQYPYLDCDFSLIFRCGKPLEAVKPEGAKLIPRQ